MTEEQRMTGTGEQPKDRGNVDDALLQTLIDKLRQEIREEVARTNRGLEETADEPWKIKMNQDTTLSCIWTKAEEPMGVEDWSSCMESVGAAVKSISLFNIFPVQGESMTGVMCIPTLVDSGFLNRSNCDALMHEEIFNAFFRPSGLNMNYDEVKIRGATRNAVPVTGTFWARLTVNGDNDYLHDVTGKMFSIGVASLYLYL